jgi:simple sugar transport system permease protein
MSILARTEDFVVEHDVVDTTRSLSRRLGTGGVFVVLGIITIWALGLALHGGHKTALKLDAPHTYFSIANIDVPGRAVIIVLGALIIGLGVWQAARGFGKQALPIVIGVVSVAFLIAFLCWVSARGTGTQLNVLGMLQNTIGLAVPLILGALAGVMCERSGVINVAIEGQMLAGAWAAALFGSVIGSVAGLFSAAVAGGLMGLLLAVFAIRYLVNQVVLGVVLNVFALGLTGFFYDAFMQPNTASLNTPKVLGEIDVPVLSHIPIVGPLLFQANLVVYLTYVLIVGVDVALFRTRWGLRTRAVGEHPKAADTVGINVLAMRYRNVVMGGALAGLGGAYFSIVAVSGFAKNITSGNGFIALAAVIFGRWSPRGAVAAALLFGFFQALQVMLSINVPSVPSNFIQMLPYVATIVAVAGLVGKVRAPAADGEPYVKE